jgi:adenylate kinase family enzyme
MRAINKIAFLVMIIGLPALAQTPERAKLQAELDDLSTALERLARQQQALSLQADSLAKDIQRRKQQTPSLLQERSLDAALRFSQTLADSLQTLQARAQRLDYTLRQKAESLLKILNDDIGRLVKQGEELKRSKNASQRERLARELRQSREWQRRCQQWLEQPPPAITIYQVEARPDDAPETLRRKADFLRDQSDRLHREVKRLDAKIANIRDETQVRRRVADFVTDLSLLDPNRERVSSLSPSAEARESGITEIGPKTDERNFLNLSNPQSLVNQNWPTQLDELSFEDLERWRGRLEQQKRRRQGQADSLAKRAVEIERLIDKQEKPAGEKRQ